MRGTVRRATETIRALRDQIGRRWIGLEPTGGELAGLDRGGVERIGEGLWAHDDRNGPECNWPESTGDDGMGSEGIGMEGLCGTMRKWMERSGWDRKGLDGTRLERCF